MEISNYTYDGDYSKITNLEEAERRAYINALCVTANKQEAAEALGVGLRTVFRFCKEEGLEESHIKAMRLRFLENNTKKLIFVYANGKKKKINC